MPDHEASEAGENPLLALFNRIAEHKAKESGEMREVIHMCCELRVSRLCEAHRAYAADPTEETAGKVAVLVESVSSSVRDDVYLKLKESFPVSERYLSRPA